MLAAVVMIATAACGDNTTAQGQESTRYIEPSPQRNGDATVGYQYLIYGDFVSSGLPLSIYRSARGMSTDDLHRTGDSKGVRYDYNAIVRDGVKLAVPTCLNCHAQKLFGNLVIGLGDSTVDFVGSQKTTITAADSFIKSSFGESSPTYQAFLPFKQGSLAIADEIVTDVRGVNSANKLFAVLAAHRDPVTLAWTEVAREVIPPGTFAADTPAWWHLKKKNALYAAAIGQGDFGRLSAASGMLTLRTVEEAQAEDAKFPDLMAWMRTIEAPKYPFPIDAALAQTGAAVFAKTCSRCHGTYAATAAESDTYPNLLVDLDYIGTDRAMIESYEQQPQFLTWYNQSWYATGPNKANLTAMHGYIAPPLDGIWATAPYLHNGSVPSLATMLDSSKRPAFWSRSFATEIADYDAVAVGWKYQVKTSQDDSVTYDTTKWSYSNSGHIFGDSLTDDERAAVIEYLKTL
jgi:mono/diheme cytochrome c family protein